MTLFYRDADDGTLSETTLTKCMAACDVDGTPLVAHSASGDEFRGIFLEEGMSDEGSVILLTQWNPAKGPIAVADDAGRDVLVDACALSGFPQSVCDTLMLCDAAQAAALVKAVTRFSALLGWDLSAEMNNV